MGGPIPIPVPFLYRVLVSMVAIGGLDWRLAIGDWAVLIGGLDWRLGGWAVSGWAIGGWLGVW